MKASIKMYGRFFVERDIFDQGKHALQFIITDDPSQVFIFEGVSVVMI